MVFLIEPLRKLRHGSQELQRSKINDLLKRIIDGIELSGPRSSRGPKSIDSRDRTNKEIEVAGPGAPEVQHQ